MAAIHFSFAAPNCPRPTISISFAAPNCPRPTISTLRSLPLHRVSMPLPSASRSQITHAIAEERFNTCESREKDTINSLVIHQNMTSKDTDPRIARISSAIRVIPDFPKLGIIFQDVTTLLLDHRAFQDTIDIFVERYRGENISAVAGIEARGFIFGPPIALAIGAKFIPMRKPKKLPGAVISEEYSLEYGVDKIEMHVGSVEIGERAIVVDDLVATGGTLSAAVRLLERTGANVVECACLVELLGLKGRDRLGEKPLFTLIHAA